MDKYNQVSLSEFQINRVNELIDKVAKRQILDFGNINAETKDDGKAEGHKKGEKEGKRRNQ